MTLGLTGGMGCGKSTALRFFAELGWRTLDSDAIVRDEVLRDPEVSAAIGARFPDVIDAAGAVRRDVLAMRVFAEDGGADLDWLEALVLPRVLARWRTALATEPAARWVVEAPLLFEKKLEKGFDFTVCVAASSPSQLARLTGRGLSPTLAGQRISRQLPLAKKTELADFVLSNDGTPEALRRQVALLAAQLNSARH
ncbi:MAG: dephospho-CoA kinase [Verrucomicrobiota bacterium]